MKDYTVKFQVGDEPPHISEEIHTRYETELVLLKVDDITIGSLNLRKGIRWPEVIKQLVVLHPEVFRVL